MKKRIFILQVIILLLVLGGVYFTVHKKAHTLVNVNANIHVTNTQSDSNVITPTSNMDTSKWNVYNDSSVGFSLRYPKEWKAPVKGDPQMFGSFSQSNVTISHLIIFTYQKITDVPEASIDPAPKTLEDLYNFYLNNPAALGQRILTFNGIRGYEIGEGSSDGVNYFIFFANKKGNIIQLSFDSGVSSDQENAVLSTIQLSK